MKRISGGLMFPVLMQIISKSLTMYFNIYNSENPFLYDDLQSKISAQIYPETKFSYPDNTAMKFTNSVHTLKRVN